MTLYEDPRDVRLVQGVGGRLGAFNQAGVLVAADVHVATRLTALAGETDEIVALAVAMAVRAPRLGHVYVDLATIAATAAVDTEDEVDLSALPWPAPDAWAAAVAASPLTAVGEGDGTPADRPLRLTGTALYLDRYWREERRLAADLRAFMTGGETAHDEGRLQEGLGRLFDAGRQREAAEAAVRRRFAVVAGGPGTGKTTTVAGIVALLAEQGGDPIVALAAPTGKAAARLEQAVHQQAALLDVAPEIRNRLTGLHASTLHRLLGWVPGRSQFRHHRGNRLPHDVVIVDETSMVSLSLMARLVEAVRADARLILVGDPGQLTSIEAGAVLGDVVSTEPHDGIVVLDRVHRFGGAIADLAAAVRDGDADAALGVLAAGHDDIAWVAAPEEAGALDPVLARAVAAARTTIAAGRAGDARAAIDALGAFRLLCAHRRGEHGVAGWLVEIERRLGPQVTGDRFYPGRPLLVTENDYALKLYNGDTGVIVATADGVAAAFERRDGLVEIRPTRLAAVDTVYAMTVHKSQGSQFDAVAVLLPPPASPLLTRELLYTAVTRARTHLIVAGSEATIRAAVGRPAARASGLGRRVWDL